MTYIIAEAGTGHFDPAPEERYLKAIRLVHAAKDAGADAVKFQAFFDEPLFCPFDGDEKRWERWRQTFLTEDQWLDLYGQIGIDVILSVFSNRGVELLKKMKPRYIKVASRAATTFPCEEFPEDTPFIISSGMVEVDDAWQSDSVISLQCSMKYPTPLGEARWYCPSATGKEGLSDHSGTVWPGIDAICRGARFLEVHFTIPGTDPGPDAPVCLNTDQLKLLCEARDAVATMRGYRSGKQKENTGTP